MPENIKQKSAAEFFCEHQQIAGFDNPGKSLFTSIRELVENSLDAAESISVLPNISLKIVEYTEEEHNTLHGIKKKPSAADVAGAAAAASGTASNGDRPAADGAGGSDSAGGPTPSPSATPTPSPAPTPSGKKSKAAAVSAQLASRMYYKISCRDNGCGMAEADIGNLLGRVLSGSKHGIKQTRGKFGLGAKMALIWSKKSSGLPIEIASCRPSGAGTNPVTVMVLDMDIYKNEPRIVSCRKVNNQEFCAAAGITTTAADCIGAGDHHPWHGTEISITISGSWSNYKARVLQYFQQLAVITPYAEISVSFQAHASSRVGDAGPSKRDFVLMFHRRSEQMPPIAREILPHPSSLNHITLTKLLQDSRFYKTSLRKCMTNEMSGISPTVADKIIAALLVASESGDDYDPGAKGGKDLAPAQMTAKHITALSQILRDEKAIKPPSHVVAVGNSQLSTVSASSCLSPVGEYNLRLGIIKELRPRLIATYSDASAATSATMGTHHYEGHPFVVEAAVALGSHSQSDDSAADASSSAASSGGSGGSAKEQQYGIHIYRFANRIPLLFETGADVVTQVATKHIQWPTYLIDPKRDNIGVFVSIVSTKIPYKGTSKEYVGADVAEIHRAVKHAIQSCCQQLRVQLQKSLKLRQEQERKKTLLKYVPDICNSLHGLLLAFKQQQEEDAEERAVVVPSSAAAAASSAPESRKRGRTGSRSTAAETSAAVAQTGADEARATKGGSSRKMLKLLRQMDEGALTAATLSECLAVGVKRFDEELSTGVGAASGSGTGSSGGGASGGVGGSGNLSTMLSTAAATRSDIEQRDCLFLDSNSSGNNSGNKKNSSNEYAHALFDPACITAGGYSKAQATAGSQQWDSLLMSQDHDSVLVERVGGLVDWVPVGVPGGGGPQVPRIFAHVM